MAEGLLQEVYSQLLPISGGRLILPRTSVVEVMGYAKPKNRPDDAPDWLLGMINWQGQEIPLISFEGAAGQAVPERGRRARITVLYAIGGKLQPSVFAVLTQGYPYLVRVNPAVLQIEGEVEPGTPVLVKLRMANERPFIPDLEMLEDMLVEALGGEKRVTEPGFEDSLAGVQGESTDFGTESNTAFDDTTVGEHNAPTFDLDDIEFDVPDEKDEDKDKE